MKSGIYKICNLITGHIYIGQSVNVRYRIRRHRQMLRDGHHENDYLLKSCTKYGLENFAFEILEYCDLPNLDERERFWISQYNSMNRGNGYNLESGGNPQKVLAECVKEKKRGKNNPMYGKHWNEKQRINITLANRANSKKLTENDVAVIKQRLVNGTERKQIAIDYNLDITTVSKIVKCKNWRWVRPDLEEALVSLWKNQTNEKRQKAVELRLAGYDYRQIASELHITSKDVKSAYDAYVNTEVKRCGNAHGSP